MKRKIVYALLAVLIALGLWFYVVTVVNPEWQDTFYNIPVALENEEILMERGFMLISEESPTVTLRLSGNRTDMIKLNSSNITLRADLSRIYSAGEQSLNYSIVYPGDVPNNAFEIISQTPQQITLRVVERKAKAVDVVLKLTGAEPGYKAMAEEALLDYEKITIAGPADIIDRIVAAEVAIDLTGQKESINQEFDYVLRDAEGNAVESKWIKATPQKINCSLKIQKVQDVTVSVEVLEGGGLKAGNYQVTYYNQETGEVISNPIAISGSETQFTVAQSDGLLRDDKLFFDKKIDLAQVSGTPVAGGGLEIVVQDLSLDDLLAPYEIINQSDISLVKVVVKIPKLTTKEIKVTNIVTEGIPAGLQAHVVTPSLKVILRGPSYELNWITEKDLKIIVDFTGAAAGDQAAEFTAKVILNMTNRKESVVVGTYKVEANVTPA